MNPTFNGAALAEQTGSGLAGTPFVELIDAGGSRAGRFQMFSFEGNTEGWTATPNADLGAFVLPGAYVLRYSTGSEPFPMWPQNTAMPLGCAAVSP